MLEQDVEYDVPIQRDQCDEESVSSKEVEDDSEGSGLEEMNDSDGEWISFDGDSESEDESWIDSGDASFDDLASTKGEFEEDELEAINGRDKGTPLISAKVFSITEPGSSNSADGDLKPKEAPDIAGALLGRLPAEKSFVISAWKEILASFTDDFNFSSIGNMEDVDSTSGGLIPWPKDFSTNSITEFDSKRLLRALKRLHGSMSRIFGDVLDGETPMKQTISKYAARKGTGKNALAKVSKEHIANPANYEEVGQTISDISPGLARRRSRKDAKTSARLQNSKNIMRTVEKDAEKTALDKVEGLTDEILGSRRSEKNEFPLRRAEHYTSLEVALSLLDEEYFNDQVTAAVRSLTAKSQWLTTHWKEATQACKRLVALDILKAVPEHEVAAVQANFVQSSKQYLDLWRKHTVPTLIGQLIHRNFKDYDKKALRAIAAEHITDVKKYRAEFASDKERLVTKSGSPYPPNKDHRLAIKILDNLEANMRESSLVQADGLAVALMESYLERPNPSRNSFMKSTISFATVPKRSYGRTAANRNIGTQHDQDSAISRAHHTEAGDAEPLSKNGGFQEGEDAEMPTAKRLKTKASHVWLPGETIHFKL